ncbi:molybdate ABC transporter permease [Rodentibacter caecimuris]|uniref:Molybdenum transport system permease n=1 Tax=Rodentibacter caecimuris TaxID=1796644 RepID=A0A9X8VZS5_9PAST|nr:MULTISPECIES: molybdate ABC transporter permease subunit [Pasteurellaceae]AOF52308.1 Molybdenum transport system permease protein ModB [Pasteurellaceae bacterium NI1060]MCQ9122483.1 molybdate ABC transporter permease subunit [Rodentibacter heylii]MCR1836363.1 molybdate ABC transporter permease subunit [Pasteurella caecimuris]MCU0105886.1 molybdate ABC transporter permease subunit [Pasteurella caecimuris]MCX2962155.1 molybdate ABC transporter permease subunit [Rodentibacter heylii]
MLTQFLSLFNLSPLETDAIRLSLSVAFSAMCWSLPLAIFVAWLLARKNFYGKSLVSGIIHLPLVLPPVVIGYVLLVAMGRNGFIGQYLYQWFGLSFGFSWKGAVLASAVVAFPLVVRAIRLSLESIDVRFEQAAQTLGASPWRVFFSITFPLSLPGVLAGLILGFARSLGEFGATITFVSNIAGETQTIPLAMYSFIQTPGAEAQAARLCVFAIILSLISLLASEWLSKYMQKKLGRGNVAN